MRWFRVLKPVPTPTPPGTFKDWKPLLAQEGRHQCVYCAISEAKNGGIYNFHVEHFEPKSQPSHRVNDWNNLLYACGICNVFKGDDWPDPQGLTAFLDPTIIDLSDEFEVSGGGKVSARSSRGRYMLERLYLNRPHLKFERVEAELRDRVKVLRRRLTGLAAESLPDEIGAMLREANVVLSCIEDIQGRLQSVPPYRPHDIRRPNHR